MATRRPFLNLATLNLATLLVAAAACVLLFGLPRLLVTCSGGEAGARHVEFVHVPGTCCGHDHGPAAATTSGRAPVRPATPIAADPCCEHGTFAFELLPPERSHRSVDLPPPQVLGYVTAAFVMPVAAAPRRAATATGPPRPDPRLALRETTLLLL